MNAAFASYVLCALHFSTPLVLKDVPVASTLAEQSLGLSGVDDVSPGMLFSWQGTKPREFWMHNTRVALAVLFLDDDGRVFDIQYMEPNSDDLHTSPQPAREALELPAADVTGFHLKIGDRLIDRQCHKES